MYNERRKSEVALLGMKSGFAVLIGRSNVGKSTLLNALVGSKVAITTPKAQTTRHAIHGVVTEEPGQIVFVDTPGVLQKSDQLTKKLLKIVRESLKDIDVIVYVADPTREIGDEEHQILRMVKDIEKPKIFVINKIDQRRKPFLDNYRDLAESFDRIVEVSALRGSHIGELKQQIFELLPEGEPYYPAGQLTNMPNDFLIAELIREKLYLRLRQELPYQIHVVVDEIEERDNGTLFIAARVITSEPGHKSMIIGKGGRGIKEIGQSARKELEAVTNKKVYLELEVEVDQHWMEKFI
ncbi:MAG: GTPase Era [Candidatus Uhrbacteria bacterium]|nr:GTPase Era [Patescibacteria group bacterium]MBU1906759.1 GTPase Era [Patescibacteria group bacterium]